MTRARNSYGRGLGWSRILAGWMGALFWTLVVDAQHTEAVCNVSSLSWSFNSLNQSPCIVAAYLGSPCAPNGNYDVPAIGPGLFYIPSQIPSICECSTVTYSLYSACAACQDALIDPWTLYTQNCSKTSPDGQYAFAIPPGTAIPKWAYQLVTSTNRFNLTLAQQVGDKPENITSVSPTITSSTVIPSTTAGVGGGGGGGLTSTTTGTNSSPSPSNTSSKSKSTPIGAIVGGVVGGVGGLALIAGGLIFCLLRNKKKNEPTYDNRYLVQQVPDGRPMSIVTSSPQPANLSSGPPVYVPVPANPVQNKLYDPEDPSTFPVTPGPNWSTHEPTLIGASTVPLSTEYNYYGHEPRVEV